MFGVAVATLGEMGADLVDSLILLQKFSFGARDGAHPRTTGLGVASCSCVGENWALVSPSQQANH
jgi:hypothetical protein